MNITTGMLARANAELEKNVDFMNWLNDKQPVFTRQMTEEEKAQIFGGNPDYIRNIGRNSDDKEWRKVNDEQS